jgi:hypothetical protein
MRTAQNGTMTNKKVILKMPKVLESLGSGAMQILDFGFRISDFGFKNSCGNWALNSSLLQSAIQNPKSKIKVTPMLQN